MMDMYRKSACLGLALMTFAMFSGCGKKEYKAPPINEGALAGNWIEMEKKAQLSARTAQPTQEKQTTFKHLTINPDKSFVFTVCDAAGKPLGGGKAEGTLSINREQHEITFTVSNSTFKAGDAGANWMPAISNSFKEELIDGATKMLILTVTDANGSVAKFKKAE